MTTFVWRIAVDTPSYSAKDLSGTGAKLTGGRWNPAGIALVYASTSIALAALETVVHFKSSGLPLLRHLVRLEIPDETWAGAQWLSAIDAPSAWDAIPPARASMDAGAEFVRRGESALMLVPSVIIPEEFNVLINPAHLDSAAIKAFKMRKWSYDPRLLHPERAESSPLTDR